MGAEDSSDVKNNIHNKMQSWGEGARAIVAVDYLCGGGHVFMAEFTNGEVHYVDPQNAMENCEEYFNIINTRTVNILRTDNCAFTDNVRDCCEGTAYD